MLDAAKGAENPISGYESAANSGAGRPAVDGFAAGFDFVTTLLHGVIVAVVLIAWDVGCNLRIFPLWAMGRTRARVLAGVVGRIATLWDVL